MRSVPRSFSLLVLPLLTIAACSRRPGGDAADAAAADAATAAASAAPSASAIALAPDAALPTAANPCSATLTTPAATIEKVTSVDILRALIPSIDPNNLIARTTKGSNGVNVTSCLGETAEANWEMHETPPNPPNGKIEMGLRQPLPNSREFVFAMTGLPAGACNAQNGFAAIMRLDQGRVVADGVGTWFRDCDKPTKLRIVKLAGEEAYVDSVHFGTGAGNTQTENVWMIVGKKLVQIGAYEVGEDSGGIQDANNLFTSMTGTSTYPGGAEVTVHQEWVHQVDLAKISPTDKKEAIDVKYYYSNGHLKAERPPAAPAASASAGKPAPAPKKKP